MEKFLYLLSNSFNFINKFLISFISMANVRTYVNGCYSPLRLVIRFSVDIFSFDYSLNLFKSQNFGKILMRVLFFGPSYVYFSLYAVEKPPLVFICVNVEFLGVSVD